MFGDQTLLSPKFDVNEYLRHTLQLPSYDTEQQRIARCTETVNTDIQRVVAEHHEGLLDQVVALSDAETAVDGVRSAVQSLQNSSKRLRHTIQEPCDNIQTMITQLKNVMDTVELVRRVQKFVSLVTKLREMVATEPMDIPRCARTIRDVEDVLAEADLSGIEVVDREMDFVTNASASVRGKAHDLLRQALSTQAQSDVGVALQSFYSFDNLPRVIHGVISEQKRDALTVVVKELDLPAIQKAITNDTRGTEGQRTRDTVFNRVDAAFTAVVTHARALAMLWRVLHRKRDPITQQLFSSALSFDVSPLEDYWTTVSAQLKERLQKIAKRGNLHTMVVSEYARFYRVLSTFTTDMRDFVSVMRNPSLDGVDDATEEELHKWTEEVTHEVEQHFSAHSLDRLRERVHPTLSKLASLLPSTAAENHTADVDSVDFRKTASVPACAQQLDVRQFMKAVVQEVTTYRHEEYVLAIVLKNVQSSIASLVAKIVDSAGKTTPTAGNRAMTNAQLFHVNVINALSVIVAEGSAALNIMPHASTAESSIAISCGKIREALQLADETVNSVLRPLLEGSTKSIAAHMDSLHSMYDAPPVPGEASHFVSQLEEKAIQFMKRMGCFLDRSNHHVDAALRSLAIAVVRQFIVRATLLRPLPEATKLQLTSDAAQLQAIVSNIYPIERTVAYKELKAVRALLFCELGNVVSSMKASLASLHPLIVLHHVFQRVPPTALVSIHVQMRQTEAQYAQLTERLVGEREVTACSVVWESVQKCLRDFEKLTNVAELSPQDKAHVLDIVRSIEDIVLPR